MISRQVGRLLAFGIALVAFWAESGAYHDRGSTGWTAPEGVTDLVDVHLVRNGHRRNPIVGALDGPVGGDEACMTAPASVDAMLIAIPVALRSA